jgi:hypothetical protein
MLQLCAPAIIYLLFSFTQILIDTFNGMYNTVFIKIIVTIVVTLLLNILCERGLGLVSWIIVFIPFILMTVIVTMLLYVFGLDVATGTITAPQSNAVSCSKNVTIERNGDIVVYNPSYNPMVHPVYYSSPNIVIPNSNP